MKNSMTLIVFLLSFYLGFSQKDITWDDLAQVTFTEKFFPAYGEDFLYPKFGKGVRSLEGKKVSIVGYFMNIDPNGKMFFLSKNPMSACFFCGVGGPETAMELQFGSKPDFRTDDIVMVTGVLKLNADDVEHFNYILTNCKAQRL